MIVIEEIKHRKDIKCIENKQQNGRGSSLLVITHYVNGLNATPENGLAEWIWKHDQTICCLQETHFGLKDRNWK